MGKSDMVAVRNDTLIGDFHSIRFNYCYQSLLYS